MSCGDLWANWSLTKFHRWYYSNSRAIEASSIEDLLWEVRRMVISGESIEIQFQKWVTLNICAVKAASFLYSYPRIDPNEVATMGKLEIEEEGRIWRKNRRMKSIRLEKGTDWIAESDNGLKWCTISLSNGVRQSTDKRVHYRKQVHRRYWRKIESMNNFIPF